MRIFFVFLTGTTRTEVEAYLNTALRYCDVTENWVRDQGHDPMAYFSWYDTFDAEWSAEALAELRGRIGGLFEATTLLGHLSRLPGAATAARAAVGELLARFGGVAQDELSERLWTAQELSTGAAFLVLGDP
jgi:hypothetical protein